jgi:hypothetical protein
MGFWTTASLKWSITAAIANTPPNRSYRLGSAICLLLSSSLPHHEAEDGEEDLAFATRSDAYDAVMKGLEVRKPLYQVEARPVKT